MPIGRQNVEMQEVISMSGVQLQFFIFGIAMFVVGFLQWDVSAFLVLPCFLIVTSNSLCRDLLGNCFTFNLKISGPF